MVLVVGNVVPCQAFNPAAIQVSPQAQAKVLSSTLQITIYSLVQPENAPHGLQPGAQVKERIVQGQGYTIGRGLGTVIEASGERLILTHDHWKQLISSADLVEFSDAAGMLLAAISGSQFRRLLRYQDPGTAILTAPAGVNLPPAMLEDCAQVTSGDQVLLARRNPERIEQVQVIAARLSGTRELQGENAWTLETIDGTLSPGDSGGGVWLNGKVIGNNWAVDQIKGWNWSTLKSELVSTDHSYAARNSEYVRLWMDMISEDQSGMKNNELSHHRESE